MGTKKLLGLGVIACSMNLLAGCKPEVEVGAETRRTVERSVSEFSKAHDHVGTALEEIAKAAVLHQPENWRDAFKELAVQLRGMGAEVIAKELTQYSDHVLGEFNGQLMADIAYMQETLVVTLNDLSVAMAEASTKAVEQGEGKTSHEKFVLLMQNLKFKPTYPKPKVVAHNPQNVTVKVKDEAETTLVVGDPQTYEVRGWGLKLLPGGTAEFELWKMIPNGNDWDKEKLPSHVFSIGGPFLLKVNMGYPEVKWTKVEGQKVQLRYGEQVMLEWDVRFDRSEVEAMLAQRAEEARKAEEARVAAEEAERKANPRIRAVLVRVLTTGNDKDEEVAFSFLVHLPGVGGLAGTGELGSGEVWPDNPVDDRTIRIELPEDKWFRKNDRLKYALRHSYHCGDGDPNWFGSVEVRGETETGDTIALLGNTGEYEMGHHDEGKRPERTTRDFQFNQ